MKRKLFYVLSLLAMTSVLSTACNQSTDDSSSYVEPTSSSVEEEHVCKDIAEARQIATNAGSTGTTEKYTVTGTIKSIKSAVYGQVVITDSTGDLDVFGIYAEDGTRYDGMKEIPGVGDTVTLKGALKTYNDEPEMDKSTLISLKRGEIDESAYAQKTLAEARSLPADSLVKVTGVVANFNVNSSFARIGFWIVDNTSSMYVYDAVACAGLSVGNTVTLLAKKTYFVLESEASNAEKWGYIGASQLTSVHVKENDGKVSAVDYSWCENTTVKKMVNTPFSEDVASKIYNVNAYIKKSQGSGFVNYYIDDLDGYTGSYVYTLANGSDLSWLEEFDGKICTVKLVAINAKSSSTGCVWRFYPIAVQDDNFSMKAEDIPDYVLEYHVKDVFKDEYDSNPALEVPTSVSSEILKFSDAKVEYSSTDTSVISFSTESDKTTMNLNGYGKATITATATYQTYSASWSKEITYTKTQEYDTITVAKAIEAEDGTEVYVEGIVSSGYPVKKGFFITDTTGTIAVLPSDGETTCGELTIGNRVIVKGTRNTYKASGHESDYYGQIEIDNASVVKNYYGSNSISEDAYIKDKTIDDIATLAQDVTVAQPKAYQCKALIHVYATSYSSTLYLMSTKDESVYLMAYSSGISQYSWIVDAFKDQVVTVNFMLMSPNYKSYYRCIPFSATDGTKTVYNENYLKKMAA